MEEFLRYYLKRKQRIFWNNLKTKIILIVGMVIISVIFLDGCSSEPQMVLESVQESGADTSQEEATATDGTEEARDAEKEGMESEESNEKQKNLQDTVFVYMCGQVKSPGVYELPAGSRICDGIRAAEGTLSEAAVDQINQAEILEDGERIYVPSKEEVEKALATGGGWSAESSGGMTAGEETGSGKVNLNTASKEELMGLTGIGEAKANAIIKYRENSGKFGKPEDLMNVEGIKEGTYNKIKDDIII